MSHRETVGDQMAAWHATKREIHELTKRLTFIHDCLSNGDGTRALDAEGGELVTVIGRLYELQEAQLELLQQTVDKAGDGLRASGLTQNGTMPSQELQARLHAFMHTKLPLVRPPYGAFCGRVQPGRREVIPPGSFVCVESPGRRRQQHILGMVTDYIAGTYFILDVAPEGRARPRFRRKRGTLQAMPTELPRQLNTPACFRPHETVLALYPLEAGEWTTMFYGAELVHPPAARGKGYTVHYQGEDRKLFKVPERFIVSRPREEDK